MSREWTTTIDYHNISWWEDKKKTLLQFQLKHVTYESVLPRIMNNVYNHTHGTWFTVARIWCNTHTPKEKKHSKIEKQLTANHLAGIFIAAFDRLCSGSKRLNSIGFSNLSCNFGSTATANATQVIYIFIDCCHSIEMRHQMVYIVVYRLLFCYSTV